MFIVPWPDCYIRRSFIVIGDFSDILDISGARLFFTLSISFSLSFTVACHSAIEKAHILYHLLDIQWVDIIIIFFISSLTILLSTFTIQHNPQLQTLNSSNYIVVVDH